MSFAGLIKGLAVLGVAALPKTSTSFNPIWKGDTADPAIGNGSLTGKVTKIGNQLLVSIEMQTGTTTTFGNGSPLYFQLPPPFASNAVAVGEGSVFGLRSGVAFVAGTAFMLPTTNKIYLVSNGAGNFWTATQPQSWAGPTDYWKVGLRIPVA